LAQKATNKAMGNGIYLKKGSYIARVETDGQGLYLKPYKGSGLAWFVFETGGSSF